MGGHIYGFQQLYMQRDRYGYHLDRGKWEPSEIEPDAIIKG